MLCSFSFKITCYALLNLFLCNFLGACRCVKSRLFFELFLYSFIFLLKFCSSIKRLLGFVCLHNSRPQEYQTIFSIEYISVVFIKFAWLNMDKTKFFFRPNLLHFCIGHPTRYLCFCDGQRHSRQKFFLIF